MKKKILIISHDKSLKEVLTFCFDGWGYEVVLLDSVANDINPIKKISPDVIVVDVYSASKIHLEVCRLLKSDFMTTFIPVIALINKRQLKTQLLNLKHGVDDYLIKAPDPLDLRVRVEMAIRRSQYSFYASPLTGLPGGRNIEEVLKDRIKKNTPFSFGYLDIDNFKYFNDSYGYFRGDRAIMQTAYILYSAMRKIGNKNDFMGHIGGDDFVFITTPDKYMMICHELVSMFDKLMPFHYTEADRKRGFIIAEDRTHKIKDIPLMSISIAVVNKFNTPDTKNIIEINEKVAEIKRYLKGFSGSKFMSDRRKTVSGAAPEPRIYRKEKDAPGNYKPLGQMLMENNLISADKLEEALALHWRRGILFGEIIKELGYVTEEQIKEIIVKSDSSIYNKRKNTDVKCIPERGTE